MRWLIPLALVVAGAACTDPDAPEKCRAFTVAYCDARVELCDQVTEDACDEEVEENIDCDLAVQVGDDYELCLDELAVLEECPRTLPAECGGVIELEVGALDDEDE